MKSDVYFNLHKRLWSVKNLETGRVAGDHRDMIVLHDCYFVVSEAGRQRVLREKKKNVNAYVRGYEFAAGAVPPDKEDCIPVSYNPYKGPHFIRQDSDEPIKTASIVIMFIDNNKPCVWAYGVT